MSQDNTSEVVVPTVSKSGSKKKSEAQKLYPKKLDKKKEVAGNEFEFSGRIDTINVKGSGVNGNHFQFSLIDKKGTRKSYLLDPAEPLRFATMANLLTAATGAGAKVKIRSVLNPDGSSFASELEVRIKIKFLRSLFLEFRRCRLCANTDQIYRLCKIVETGFGCSDSAG